MENKEKSHNGFKFMVIILLLIICFSVFTEKRLDRTINAKLDFVINDTTITNKIDYDNKSYFWKYIEKNKTKN